MIAERDPQLVSVGISVSPCEDADAIGYDERQINRIVIRIAQYFLYKNMRVIFGHDWRENGVMHAVLNCAETAAAAVESHDRQARMVNLVSTGGAPISQIAVDAQRDARGLLAVRTLHDDLTASVAADSASETLSKADELSVLHYHLTELLSPGFRVCLGGRVGGFEGHYPGVAEEAYFALAMNKPLYLIGGFGGATAAVCAALVGHDAASLSPAHRAPTSWQHNEPYMEWLPPTRGLYEPLREFGLDRLTRNNGLRPVENEELFNTTDIEAALGLVSRGIQHAPSITWGSGR